VALTASLGISTALQAAITESKAFFTASTSIAGGALARAASDTSFSILVKASRAALSSFPVSAA
jgi:hypothetical protein